MWSQVIKTFTNTEVSFSWNTSWESSSYRSSGLQILLHTLFSLSSFLLQVSFSSVLSRILAHETQLIDHFPPQLFIPWCLLKYRSWFADLVVSLKEMRQLTEIHGTD